MSNNESQTCIQCDAKLPAGFPDDQCPMCEDCLAEQYDWERRQEDKEIEGIQSLYDCYVYLRDYCTAI